MAMIADTGSTTSTTLPVFRYETAMQRHARLLALKQRESSKRRGKCYVCWEDHHVRDCPKQQGLPQNEWEEVVQMAVLNIPCWNCGKPGHKKADCNQTATAVLQTQTSPMDMAGIRNSVDPFASYCTLLSEQIEATTSLDIVETGLVASSAESKQHQQEQNWNGKRKSVYIIASR
jgi:hypothetical protein